MQAFCGPVQEKKVKEGVGRIGKNRAYISASAPKGLVELIDARAKALGWSRAKYAVAVIEKWHAEGAPSINKIDETMRATVMDAFTKRNRRKAA
jgi:hypothetical protein